MVFLIINVDLFSQKNHVRFDHLTINNGLSQSSVRAIYQDSYGFMWFGTNDGLNRYDGYEFKIFKNIPDDSTSIVDNIIYDIKEDANGYLWVATSNGLSKYDRVSNTFRQIHIPNKEKSSFSNSVNSLIILHKSKANIVWFSTLSGVFRYDENKRKIEFYKIIQNEKVTDIDKKIYLHVDKANNIWAFTNMYGIYKWNEQKNEFEKIVFKNVNKLKVLTQLTAPYEDEDRYLWFGSIKGLSKYNPKTGNIIFYKSNFENVLGQKLTTSFVNSITEGADGNLYLATGGYGLIRFNKNTSEITVYKNDPFSDRTISLDVAHKVYLDNSGVLWVGTDGKGIDKLSPYLNNFNTVLRTENGLSISSVRTFFEDAKGYLWISGYNGVDRFNTSTGNYKNFYNGSKTNKTNKINEVVYTIIEDEENPNKYLYLGTEGTGVYRYNITTETFELFYRSDSSYGENLITSLFDDGKGSLWIGTNNNLIKFDKSTRSYKKYIHNPSDPLSISPQRVTDIFKDSYGNFWIGTDKGGLNLMDIQSGSFKKFQKDNSKSIAQNDSTISRNTISGNFIKCIYEDSQRVLWIGTTNGLNKLNLHSNTFNKYTVEDGLPNNVIYGILEDSQERLWLSTNYGLSCFDIATKSFKNYNYLDGLQSNEFNTNAYHKTKDGKLLFGGINGFNFFYPDEIETNKHVPNIVLTKFSLFNKPISTGQKVDGRVILPTSISVIDTIILNYHENIFSIEYSSLDYSASGKNKYMYKLEGFQNDFSAPTKNRSVTYTNLNPGTYLFTVVGSNGDNTWNMIGANILIVITPPFWLTWWFLLFIVFLISVAIYMVYKYRINKILELERLRVKIASDLHDEVGSTLTKVSMRAQMLEMQINDSVKATNLKRIAEQSREAVSTMRDIVWSIDSRNDSFGDLVTKIKDTAYSLLIEQGVKVKLNLEGIKDTDDIPLNFRQNVFLILKEALTNISKHSNADEVKISISKFQHKLTMVIQDNGTNFIEKSNYSGQGLKNMEMRAKKIEGIFSYDVNNGFKICIEISMPK